MIDAFSASRSVSTLCCEPSSSIVGRYSGKPEIGQHEPVAVEPGDDLTLISNAEPVQDRAEVQGWLGAAGLREVHARISQTIKCVMNGMQILEGETEAENARRRAKWLSLSPDKREAHEMIGHKIGRILNGDPEFHDSWHDICGYSKLVADTLQKDGGP